MDSYLSTLKCSTVEETTHLSMVGGKYRVNLENTPRFHEMYANRYINNGRGVHLVEKVLYPSKWYLDIDRVDEIILTELMEVLLAFGEPCIMCVPDTMDGAHVIFLNIRVASKQEANTRSEALLRNTRIVFDKSVYSSGLRMIGARKGREVFRIYMPYFRVLEARKGHLLVLGKKSEITPQLVSECSIHSMDPLMYMYTPIISIASRVSQYTSSISKSNFKSNSNTPLTMVDKNKSIATMTMNFSFIHSKYKEVQITKIKHTDMEFNNSLTTIRTYYVYTSNQYCVHLNREHRSACVFFEIVNTPMSTTKPKTIRCRCTCKCVNTGCSLFRGKSYQISIKLLSDIIRLHTTFTTNRNDTHSVDTIDINDVDFLDTLF
jgi:hypothetical protein